MKNPRLLTANWILSCESQPGGRWKHHVLICYRHYKCIRKKIVNAKIKAFWESVCKSRFSQFTKFCYFLLTRCTSLIHSTFEISQKPFRLVYVWQLCVCLWTKDPVARKSSCNIFTMQRNNVGRTSEMSHVGFKVHWRQFHTCEKSPSVCHRLAIYLIKKYWIKLKPSVVPSDNITNI